MLAHWDLIDADLHAFYGIDTFTGILAQRPATWLRNRIAGLLVRDSGLIRALRPDESR